MVNAYEYCTSHTSIFGQGLGISEPEFEAMVDDSYKTSDLFGECEKVVIAWSEAMTSNTAQRYRQTLEDMKEHFSETEIVEISMACAMFNMINRLNDSFLAGPGIRGFQPEAVERGPGAQRRGKRGLRVAFC